MYELLGGRARDRVRVYQWIGGDRPDDVAEQAQQRTDAGLTAVKMNPTAELARVDSGTAVTAAADRLAAVRDRGGRDLDVAVDFHGRRMDREPDWHNPSGSTTTAQSRSGDVRL